MGTIVRRLSGVVVAPGAGFSDRDAVADNRRPFRIYSDACIGCLGASWEQEQMDGEVFPIVFIHRATLLAERS